MFFCEKHRFYFAEASIYIFSYAREVVAECFFVALVDDVDKVFEFGTYLFDVTFCAWIKEDFSQQSVILRQNAFGNFVVALEGCAGSVLMLHNSGEDEGGDEGDGEAVSHGFVVLFETIFVDVEAKSAVEIEEEDAPHVVTFVDDDSVFCGECAEIGESGAKHGMSGDEAHACGFVKVAQVGLYAADVADDAGLWQMRDNLSEDVDGVFERHGINDEFGLEFVDFV